MTTRKTSAALAAALCCLSGFVGMVPSLEAAYRVGSTVVNELTGNWALYSKTLPGH
ncbi:hypothetical protein [Pseudomonas sp. TH31]|uniref:hypothetical protein n=1 Tax=Pseudomonas sp. TH31 TaxID=2796396 RepID=UPI001F5BA437|nr:hypothetical protein [Pseudomonas sp. TH31]